MEKELKECIEKATGKTFEYAKSISGIYITREQGKNDISDLRFVGYKEDFEKEYKRG